MPEHTLVKIAKNRHRMISKAIASVAVCAMGAFVMWLTKGNTGIGWAILGLALIWGSG